MSNVLEELLTFSWVGGRPQIERMLGHIGQRYIFLGCHGFDLSTATGAAGETDGRERLSVKGFIIGVDERKGLALSRQSVSRC